MNSLDSMIDLDVGRTWLNRAAAALVAGEDSSPEAIAFARAAAMVGTGFTGLAHAVRAFESMQERSQVRQAILAMSEEPETTLGEAIGREKRAEGRPHADDCDGECMRKPGVVPCSTDEVSGHMVFSAGLPIKDLRRGGFYGFTRHGHPVGGEPPAGTPARSVSRCGGLHGCAQCATDAARLRIPGRTEADLNG